MDRPGAIEVPGRFYCTDPLSDQILAATVKKS